MIRAAFVLLALGSFQHVVGQQNAMETIVSSKKIEVPDSTIKLLHWINEWFSKGNNDTIQAFNYLDPLLKTAKEQKDYYTQGYIHRAYGSIQRHYRNYHRSFGQYLWSQQAFRQTGNLYEMAVAELELARAQYYRGSYRFSLRHYSDLVKLIKENNFTDLDAEAYEILSLLYNVLQSFQQNIPKFVKALDDKHKLKDDKGIAYISGILSTGYYRNRMFDSSLYYATISLNKAEQLNMPDYINLSRLNKAYSLVRLGRWKEAEEEIAKFTVRKIRQQEVDRAVKYHVLMGNLYTARKQFEQGQRYYDSALRYANVNVFPELLEFIYRNISETYFQLGDHKMAFDYSQKYNEIISRLYTGENATNLGNIEAVLQSSLSRDAIKILNQENNIKQLQLLREAEIRSNLERENILKDSILTKEKLLSEALARENRYKNQQLRIEKDLRSSLSNTNVLQHSKLQNERSLRLLLLLGLSALLASGLIILLLYQKQRKKNIIIQKQSDELQTLMKEIHHRVKNNLQVISSLLDLQSMTIKDNQASEAVKEGKNRVQSMALIHQNLYNEGNIKGILMENYINNLAENLFQSYNIQPGKVKLKTEIEQINLDVDTVIPIGLILNELLSNSLKYAFKNTEEGVIHVQLKQQGESLLLQVKDNGSGFPPQSNISQSTSFGMKMIKAFAQKLKAKLDVYNDNGACVVMQINRYKLADV